VRAWDLGEAPPWETAEKGLYVDYPQATLRRCTSREVSHDIGIAEALGSVTSLMQARAAAASGGPITRTA